MRSLCDADIFDSDLDPAARRLGFGSLAHCLDVNRLWNSREQDVADYLAGVVAVWRVEFTDGRVHCFYEAASAEQAEEFARGMVRSVRRATPDEVQALNAEVGSAFLTR